MYIVLVMTLSADMLTLSHLNGPRYFSCLRLQSIISGGTIMSR